MKVKICGESFCRYDPDEVEEVLNCDKCPYQIEIEKEELGGEKYEQRNG